LTKKSLSELDNENNNNNNENNENKIKDNNNNNNNNDNTLTELDKSIEEKFETISKSKNIIKILYKYLKKKEFLSSTEMLKEINKLNERECRMKINQFTIEFQKNMEVLYSLSNFFEQKTFYEIEKTRNGIIDTLNYEQGDSRTKMGLIMDKIQAMMNLINEIFSNIKKRIESFEMINNQKILRMKNSYKIYLKKFLE
jgi:hypothetical protein